MSNSLHIIQHGGLGDHIICNGLIRTLVKKYDEIFININPSISKNVSYMYRDLDLKYYDLFYYEYADYMMRHPDNYLLLGCTPEFFRKLATREYKSFDFGFYTIAQVPYHYRWYNFYYQRDIQQEKIAFYEKAKLTDGEKYIFIHEDPKRDRLIDRNLISSPHRIISSADYEDINVFEFLLIIAKAEEIHVIDSCFLAFIDNMQLVHNKMYIHNYGCNKVVFPTTVKMEWKLYIDENIIQNEVYCHNYNL